MTVRRALGVASTQLGLVTTYQMEEAGLSVYEQRTLVRTGVVERRAKNVFAVAGAPHSWEQEVLTACLAGGPTAVACGPTAARVLDIGRPYFDRAGVEVCIERNGSRHAVRSVGATVHTARQLTRADRIVWRGIPVMAPARVIVDLFGRVSDDALFAAADDVLTRFSNPGAIRRTWRQVAGGRHKGSLDAVLLPWSLGPKPGSPKEMSLSRVLQLHGLPPPVRQHPVPIPGRRSPRYLDLAYVAERVAPEYDGRRDHGPRHWAADADREDELTRAGWLRLPAGRLDLVEPGAAEYCELVTQALRARAPG